MAEVSRLYTKELYRQFKYRGNWLPNKNIKLGDVGRIEKGRFTPETTLEHLRVPFIVRRGVSPTTFDYVSKSGISVKAKAAGEVAIATSIPQAQAGVLVQFDKEGAFLFQAHGCVEDMIENRDTIRNSILELRSKKIWDDDWTIITELVRADCATVLVSISRSATIELSAKTNLTLANLANVDAGLKVTGQSGRIVKVVAKKRLKPLYNVSALWSSLATRLGLSSPKLRSYNLSIGSHRAGSFPTGNSLTAQNLLVTVTPDWDDPAQ